MIRGHFQLESGCVLAEPAAAAEVSLDDLVAGGMAGAGWIDFKPCADEGGVTVKLDRKTAHIWTGGAELPAERKPHAPVITDKSEAIAELAEATARAVVAQMQIMRCSEDGASCAPGAPVVTMTGVAGHLTPRMVAVMEPMRDFVSIGHRLYKVEPIEKGDAA